MAIRNQSGNAVDYDVKPSDPGPPPPVARIQNAAAAGLTASAIGLMFTAFGCLTGFGDQAFVLAGLGFLVVGLVFQGIALDRARRLGTVSLALRSGGSGMTHLADGDEHAHTFKPGTWVEFWSKDEPPQKLAQSPMIFNSDARVTLRRCVDPQQAGRGTAPQDLGYHVDVE